MVVTETVCKDCGRSITEVEYCPHCGTGDPAVEEPLYVFDSEDLPIVFSFETYNDTYGLWRAFCGQYFGEYVSLSGSDIEGPHPDPMDMKYAVFDTWWAVDENYELHGPFMEREEAEEVVGGA